MFSFLVLYSNDRIEQFKKSINFWNNCELFEDCEKIICSDGLSNFKPEGFKLFEIPRLTQHYCWANTINTGVQNCSFENIFYFDCDRIVPKNYFSHCLNVLQNENCFVFAKYLYSLRHDLSIHKIKHIINDVKNYSDELIEDHRVLDPRIIRRKNPFSGGVGFRKQTFLNAGGFDPRYKGWGYPDTDFFYNTHIRGHKFVPIDVCELHQKHDYNVNSYLELRLHNLWNCRQYIEKWNLPKDSLEKFRVELSVSHKSLYQSGTLSEFLDHVFKKIKLF
jgi:hypothetical protein